MIKLLAHLVFLTAFSVLVSAQVATPTYFVRGSLKSPNGEVISGLKLELGSGKDRRSVTTDINGEFSTSLPEGEWEITTNRLAPEVFRVMVRVGEDEPTAHSHDLTIDPALIYKTESSGKPFPGITVSAKPVYPPAARAVRAGGEVIVALKIDKNGKVTSAIAESGNPLLRKASIKAAEEIIFKSSDLEQEREAKITYVFVPYPESMEGPARYSTPYMIEIFDLTEQN